MAQEEELDVSTSQIREWRSIVTLIVFVVTNLIVLFPFHIPIWIPRPVWNAGWSVLSTLRIIPPRPSQPDDNISSHGANEQTEEEGSRRTKYRIVRFPVDLVTAPIIADLFLLAILAIGRKEVHDGTVGTDSIHPIDIMVFFLTLAYIAISIDASGLIRYLAFKVLQKAGKNGHRLYFYLYSFFFALTTLAGNDPVILSGTAFLAYMTRVSSNIEHPRAWIYAQFAAANIGSAILVSSNPTNLVLAGAFGVKFIHYTANMIVPTIVTAIIIFPFLLYIVFPGENLIPRSIKLHELPNEFKNRKPINPNIPGGRGAAEDADDDDERHNMMQLEEIMNPFLDKGGASFGALVMATVLITILALNASSQNGHEQPVFYVTLPGAFIMFCWDIGFGWMRRKKTREIARKGREEIERARAEEHYRAKATSASKSASSSDEIQETEVASSGFGLRRTQSPDALAIEMETVDEMKSSQNQVPRSGTGFSSLNGHATTPHGVLSTPEPPKDHINDEKAPTTELEQKPSRPSGFPELGPNTCSLPPPPHQPTTLSSLLTRLHRYLGETFPTVMAVLSHLPLKLVPFAFAMFILVQALVTKGWVPVFAHGWDHWVRKTGTIGAIGGMGFLSVVLCNFAGTNIGTTILLSRIIQAWVRIAQINGTAISQRTFWATVYSMAIGVNYGAFSTAFSASLAGLLWRDILRRKHIHVRSLDFARVNLPIIAVAMVVGEAVLVGQVWISRGTGDYGGTGG
ncbi:unnamed protein product [Zymoseptoria tritici ST99CH_1A5]|uniref:Citrate transporter-like domain-containing protein n=2 Tax=Zymoseptoria tritici TaxID=1047171 RepID=A0A2H1FZ64_ZYMTR|nr:unnamed protein product [Zymoseptoria tritici ST99CH_1E4]SMR47842.1 unnamed protein product [Zymoseptoria tritici ST99CH_3D1]SMY21749.1 unnamed protein product [Zymoseptoria tritici ST99CH_1A5]